MSNHREVLIIGGGSAGLTVAARLRNLPDPPDVAIIEPSATHYYPPLWTLVGGGVMDKTVSARPEADYIPDGATWIQDHAESFDPDNNAVTTRKSGTITYDFLVVAGGIQLDWHKVKGLKDAMGKDGVCSNYSYQTVDSTWRFLKDFKSGKAVFTFPNSTIRCGGAPQKIMWLTDHHLRRTGVRENCEVIYMSAGTGIFGVERYAKTLRKIVSLRKKDTEERQEEEALLDLYMHALGMIPG